MDFYYSLTSYIAIIGDIVGSKKLTNRNSVQNNLKSILEKINRDYSTDIRSQFVITIGDEFQGLLLSGQYVVDIITEIEVQMYPIHVRFGVGVGDISTEINQYAIGADGEAFYRARGAIDEIRRCEQKKKSITTNIMISTDAQNKEFDSLINTILALCKSIKDNWTDRQRAVINYCLLNGDNQQHAAMQFGKTQSAIHKNLKSADYYPYTSAMSVVSAMLSKVIRTKGAVHNSHYDNS